MEFDNLFIFGSAEGPSSSSTQIDQETRRGREQILAGEWQQLEFSRKIKRSPLGLLLLPSRESIRWVRQPNFEKLWAA